MVLRAPGMLALHVRLDTVEAATRVRVWDDVVKAYDMGALAAQWFSDFIGGGQRLRLVRFDPEQQRLSDPQWTGELQAENAFADGFPLLVANRASLADLNRRLAARGAAPVTMQRFRPNLVLDGLQPYDEDHIDEITFDTRRRPGAAAPGQALHALLDPERRPRHGRHRHRTRRHAGRLPRRPAHARAASPSASTRSSWRASSARCASGRSGAPGCVSEAARLTPCVACLLVLPSFSFWGCGAPFAIAGFRPGGRVTFLRGGPEESHHKKRA